MVFSSMIFIWAFLPLVILINFIIGLLPINNKIVVKNVFLLLASFVFYAFGGTYYLLIMISVILINYFGALFLTKYKNYRRVIFVVSLFLNIAILFYFKYFNMFSENITIVLPIGISFYIFQSMSYLIDVYKKNVKVQNNILNLALYISFFPQLIAGPIVKYKEIFSYIKNRKENLQLFAEGVKRFIYGLSKKVLLANQLALVVDKIWANGIKGAGFFTALVISLLYSFQIYYDFSGYSDMAIGLGKMFGFQFNENFNYPYLAISITDFWRRWHISLSTWFKEYVYIPLGGSRGSHTYRNLFIVFLLTGIWHGANYSFFLWGIIYGILIILEKWKLEKKFIKNEFKVINILVTFIIVNFLWILFRADNISDVIVFIKEFANFSSSNNLKYYFDNKMTMVVIFSVFFAGLHYVVFNNTYEKIKNDKAVVVIEDFIFIILMTYSIFELTSGTYNPFIYFQF